MLGLRGGSVLKIVRKGGVSPVRRVHLPWILHAWPVLGIQHTQLLAFFVSTGTARVYRLSRIPNYVYLSSNVHPLHGMH